ncbi:MAG: valine--tRNA ligase [Spirochaetales bacterium]|nr:valine--tRNA ligase [Spirochaetales bacterium]
MAQLEKTYNPKDFEDRIYKMWMDNGYFAPNESDKQPFVIVIPPPNVTGVLHMGHGLNNALQDILIRYYRMTGVPTLWVPGTDHAGIATQHVVEKRLLKEGKTRHDLGRERFVEKTWEVKEEHHSIITRQLQKIGASCDWSRERFTLDEGLSKAVREVFVTLYERGLIYKGNYLINWCPSCTTALADDEVEHVEQQGILYHYYYPLTDGSGRIEIATTRPETMLGDTAVAVHPDDPRYTSLIGKTLELPLTGRTIPIVADTYVDMEFGTGAVKITPAHDPNDWAISKRHQLDVINILNDNGTLNNNVPERYQGLSAQEARRVVVEDLKAGGYYKNDEAHTHKVGHCYRCDTVIEPYFSKQWFVKMDTMAEKALDAWKAGHIRFYPRKWENTYKNWLEGIRDWCISRQLWWGHRIPVWYCDDCGEMMVMRQDPSACSSCGSSNIRQEEDVLDTWFSSWLWPFSTLGWPEKTADLARFYPTSSLVTGYDIIFFWVARMIMAGLEFMNEVPFRDIYMTGLVRDKQGRKMSKTLGNGMDPLEIVDEFGADAMKFTLAFMCAQGQDILIDKESFKLGSKFANKIWNAARFLLMNMEGVKILPITDITLLPIDRWILHRLNEAAGIMGQAMKGYRFNEGAQTGYEFFWNDFCDWYIEANKISLYADDQLEKQRSVSILAFILEESMKLLHPFLPFITEEIYLKLPRTQAGPESVMIADYPGYTKQYEADDICAAFSVVQDIVRSVRTMRSEFTIPPEKKIPVAVSFAQGFVHKEFVQEQEELIITLTNASGLSFNKDTLSGSGAVPVAGNGWEVYIFVKDAIDVTAEIEKMEKEQKKIEKLHSVTVNKLNNNQFMSNAPEEVIAKEMEKKKEFEERIEKLRGYIHDLR